MSLYCSWEFSHLQDSQKEGTKLLLHSIESDPCHFSHVYFQVAPMEYFSVLYFFPHFTLCFQRHTGQVHVLFAVSAAVCKFHLSHLPSFDLFRC